MKKLMLILAVLVIAAPAMAVTLSLDNGGDADGWVSINYDKGAGVMPRAFALNISVDVGVIDNYACSVTDASIEPFNVYMGNISIDNGVIVDRGSPVAPASAPDDPNQLGDSNLVIEMGSLYVPGTSDPCEPATSGTLIKLHCTDCNAVMTVTSNALRGKVVLEDTTVEGLGASGDVCGGCYTGPDTDEWDLVGKPDSWCYPRQCHGDADGTTYSGKWVLLPDLQILVKGWNQPYSGSPDVDGDDPDSDPDTWIAADFDHAPYSGKRVLLPDLQILVFYWNKAEELIPADCGESNPVSP